MKTKQQVLKEYYDSYYIDKCEYCNTDIVMTADELNNPNFFGQPELAKEDCMYKCPNCGHVNIRKIAKMQPCYQNGEIKDF